MLLVWIVCMIRTHTRGIPCKEKDKWKQIHTVCYWILLIPYLDISKLISISSFIKVWFICGFFVMTQGFYKFFMNSLYLKDKNFVDILPQHSVQLESNVIFWSLQWNSKQKNYHYKNERIAKLYIVTLI